MPAGDTNFRINGYKFLPQSMIPEFKEFPYQADEVVKAAPAVPLNKARGCRAHPVQLRLSSFGYSLARERHGNEESINRLFLPPTRPR